MRAPRRSSRPTRGGRTTGTPRARTKTNRRPTSPTTMGPRPVRKRPTKTTGTAQSKRMLPPGMDIPKKTPEQIKEEIKKRGGGKPIEVPPGSSLAEVMETVANQKRKRRAGKARSTGTPKAPTRTTRPTTATPKRGTPPTSSRPRRPRGVVKPGTPRFDTTRRPSLNTGRPPRRIGRR